MRKTRENYSLGKVINENVSQGETLPTMTYAIDVTIKSTVIVSVL